MKPDRRLAFLAIAGLAAACLAGCASDGVPTAPGHPTQGWYYRVMAGDGLNSIAERCGRPVEMIAEVNHLGNPALLYDGLYLWIPPVGKVSEADTRIAVGRGYGEKTGSASEDAADLIQAKEAKKPHESPYSKLAFWRSGRSSDSDTRTRPLDDALLAGAPSDLDGSKVLSHARVARAPDAVRLGFRWPLDPNDCKVVKTERGLDLAAPKGAPIHASRDGVVLASGSPLPGYGNMILIDHRDGYISVYAHNSENLVGKDQRVKKGDLIAKVGSTGNAEEPKLHFEIRKKTQPVEDPRSYLVEQ